jgi:hypothetical protein
VLSAFKVDYKGFVNETAGLRLDLFLLGKSAMRIG